MVWTQRMNTLDAGLLDAGGDRAGLHAGTLAIFEGPVPAQHEITLRHARQLSARARQRVRRDPLRLRRPAWEEDPHFDLSNHVRRLALPAPGDETILMTVVGRLVSAPLDDERPLWESYVIEGLADGRWA